MQPGTRKYRYGDDPFALLCRRVEPFQARLATHAIYKRVQTLDGLQVFMKNHVFAVWDFMTLTKALQQELTCVQTPWLPPRNPLAARLINEIVLGEETDEVFEGEYLSHYVLYLRAMGEIGADPTPMLEFEESLRAGKSPADALSPLGISEATKAFVLSTLETARRPTHEVAASLLLAREDLIPVMFDRVVREMDRHSGVTHRAVREIRKARSRLPSGVRSRLPSLFKDRVQAMEQQHSDPRANFRLYLQRHVHLDGEEHGPMGRRMLMSLCGEDDQLWEEATLAARAALEARLALWDGVLLSIERETASRSDSWGGTETWSGRDLANWLEQQRGEALRTADLRTAAGAAPESD